MTNGEEFEYVNGIFEKEKAAIKLKLKTALDSHEKADLIAKINVIRLSQELLRRCFEYNVTPRDIWRKVPMPKHGWSEYRLMEDYETDDRKYWREEPDFRLSGGEIVIG